MKRFCKFLVTILLLIFTFSVFCSCAKKVFYENFISEKKYNILEGKSASYFISANLSYIETPYYIDGKCGAINAFITFEMVAPDNTKEYQISYDYMGKNFNGEMNYNSGKMLFELSFNFESKDLKELDVAISCGEENELVALNSVLYNNVITPEKALNQLISSRKDLFDENTIEGNFTAEIHIRLLVQDKKCYYYIGVAKSASNIFAFLINAENGEILAEKELNYTN